MKKGLRLLFLLLCFGIFSTSCFHHKQSHHAQNASISYDGGDGMSMDNAVKISGAKNETEGIAAEYAYLAKEYTGYKLISQSLINKKGKSYDVLEIRTKENKTVKVYFDISEFAGKMYP